MRFLCDKCQTKYSIADGRVHGRVLKVRCKNCENIITLREVASEAEPASVARPAPGWGDEDGDRTVISRSPDVYALESAGLDGSEWFVSFDGEQEGPYSIEKVRERLRIEVPRGKQAHCWREGFRGWQPVEAVPEVGEMARLAKAPVRSTVPQRSVSSRAPSPPSTGSLSKPPSPPEFKASGSSDPKTVPLASVKAPGGAEPKPAPLASVKPLSGADSKSLPLSSVKPSHGSATPNLGGTKSGPRAMPLANATPVAVPFAAALAESAAATKLDVDHEVLPQKGQNPLITAMPALQAELSAPRAASGVPDDLMIGEPSGLISPMQVDDAAMVVNGAAPAAAVVVVEAPATGTPGWMKWGMVGLGLSLLGVGAVLAYVLTRPPHEVKPEVVAADSVSGHKLNDAPIAPTDTGNPTLQVDPKRSTPKRVSTIKTAAPALKASAPPNDRLSGSQRALAAIYSDEGDRVRPQQQGIPASGGHPASAGAQVSQTAILSVVTENRRSLNLCYDRVLKHDQTLKRARVPVRVKIGISGRVLNVSISDPNYAAAEIGQCLSQSIKHWNFPASDTEYETEFPIILQAE